MNIRVNGTSVHISHARSVAKALSWRVIATITTMTAVFLVSGELELALGVGAIDVIAKLIFYYAHERAWLRVQWGINKAM